MTSYNLKQFYDVLEGVLLQTGMGIPNPAYLKGEHWLSGMPCTKKD